MISFKREKKRCYRCESSGSDFGKQMSELMTLVTGTGCLLGTVLAASFTLADEDSLLDCLEEVLSAYSVAGEMAEQKTLPEPSQIEF